MFITRDAQHVVVPWRQDLAQLVPHARHFTHQGQEFLLLPNDRDEAKLARNLGVPVPPPIFTRYDWCGQTPWEVQKSTAALLVENPRAYVLSTMGTGKTRAAIFAADYLRRIGRIGRTLVAAPLSTLGPVWETELFRVLPQARVRVLYGDRAKRLRLLSEDAEFYIINHHGLALLSKALIERQFGAVVIDELAVFRNKSTELWKAAATVVNGAGTKYAWGLTGSPTPNAPTDAWAQVRLLTPQRTSRTMTQFKDQTMRQVATFVWAPRPEANDIVHTAMQPAVRFTRDDVGELPPTSYVDREVKLSAEGSKAYKLLFDKMHMLTKAGKEITAVNEGVLQSKLLQVALGYVYANDKTVFRLPDNARLDALLETVEACDRKVIVFVPFIHALEGVAEFLRDKKHNVAVVHGGTSHGRRDRIFGDFQNKDSPRVLVAHPQCMAHGLTLTSANTIVWYGPTTSLEIYEQANARIVRPSQTSKTLIVHLLGTAVERLAYTRLKTKGRMQGMLLELFRQQELEF